MTENKYPVSKAERFLHMKRGAVPVAPSYKSAKELSELRQAELSSQIERGEFIEVTGAKEDKDNKTTNMSNATIAHGLAKTADSLIKRAATTTTSGTAWSGSGGTVRQGPEVYSPLWLTSNTHLPRDRGTTNAWCRAYFALNPIVNNALSLHSTYPIAKLNISCPDKKIENFFCDMAEEMDLLNICVQMAQEFYVVGEVFPLLELDDRTRKWIRCVIQNPDFMYVKRTAIATEPEINIKPDPELKKIVFNNDPESVRLRKQIPPDIIKYVKSGKNIPLDNFYVSHLARRVSPYDTRGTSLIVSCFKALMLWDKFRECKYAQADNLINPITLIKLGGSADAEYKVTPADLELWREMMECHDEETEVLTDHGFKKFYEVIDYDINCIDNVVPAKIKDGIKIACFNADTEQLEYHVPTNTSLYNYDGDMYHFNNEKMDIMVTPNHKMWISKKEYEYNGSRELRKTKWGKWNKVKAEDINFNDYSRFRSKINWVGNDEIKTINVCGKDVPIELYLEYLGYLISEGCLYTDGKYSFMVDICQTISKHYQKMQKCANDFAQCINIKNHEKITPARKENYSDIWVSRLYGKQIYNHFKQEIQDEFGHVKANYKRIPRWVFDLSPRLLKILLDALVAGDGSIYNNPNRISKRYCYYTTSKKLADDVYELVYKCGYVPVVFTKQDKKINRLPLYILQWSTSGKGEFPLIYKTSRNSITKIKKNNIIIEKYNGKVWCFEVPTGLFITRRNGKITIQGNSAQYDKDFKIITHGSVTIERIGAQAVIDVANDITQLIKEIYIGLMVPQVIMEAGDITYANGSLSLDVLRQRYMQFQNMMTKWIKKKVFAPISQLNDFWEREAGEKKLVIPDVEWNHMNLFDLTDYVQQISQLAGERKLVSVHTLYRSLGLDYEDEQRYIRQESIDQAIHKREEENLSKMSLTDLRALDPEQEIPDVPDYPVPGESPEEAPAAGGEEAGGMGGMGGAVPSPPAGGGAPA